MSSLCILILQPLSVLALTTPFAHHNIINKKQHDHWQRNDILKKHDQPSLFVSLLTNAEAILISPLCFHFLISPAPTHQPIFYTHIFSLSPLTSNLANVLSNEMAVGAHVPPFPKTPEHSCCVQGVSRHFLRGGQNRSRKERRNIQ